MAAKVNLIEEAHAQNATKISLYAELRRRISKLNLTLYCKDSNNSVSIVTTGDNVLLVTDGSRSQRFRLCETELCPLSSSLQWNTGQELQVPLTVSASELHEEDDFANQCQRQEDWCSHIKTCQNRCYCAGCGQKIIQDNSVFSRVLPLPSENWADLAEFWFCHRHGDEGDQLPSLSPKDGDCLVDNLHILLYPKHLKKSSIKEEDNVIKCSQCERIIGQRTAVGTPRLKQNGVHHCSEQDAANSQASRQDAQRDTTGTVCHLYLHAVQFLEEAKTNFISHISEDARLELFLVQLLQEQSRLYTSYRFLIQSDNYTSSSSVKILLWLIDQSLVVYNGAGYLEESSTHTVELAPKRVAKVLYRCLVSPVKDGSSTPDDRVICKAWERDNTVHGLSLPRALCLQMIQVLVHNTKELPPSTTCLDGFNVSFLHKEGRTEDVVRDV